MELKEKYEALKGALQLQDGESFSSCVMRAAFDGGAKRAYLQVCPDLTRDELRSVWQFWHADREEKKQDYTSDSLARLCAALVDAEHAASLYDCCAGSGALTIGAWSRGFRGSVLCEELDGDVIPLLLFNLSVRNIGGIVRHTDVLTGEVFASWELTPGAEFSSIASELFPSHPSGPCDVAVSNPPFNLRDESRRPLNFEFLLKAFGAAWRSAVILPRGTMTSEAEAKQRGHIIGGGMLSACVQIPGGTFESTDIPVVVYVGGGTSASGVMLVDADSAADTEARLQRGEGDNAGRVYRKNTRVFSDAQIESICGMCRAETECSVFVPCGRLESEGYVLGFGRYARNPLDAENTKHRDYRDIIEDMNKIGRIRNGLKIVCNKKWAEQLGLLELAGMHQENARLTDQCNDMLRSLGVDAAIMAPDYLALSASKVLEIRQQDKEYLSPVFESFVPLWRQHIRTLNIMENSLLAELRDGLLGPLMRGELMPEKQGTEE